ncbi:MAG: hypothetical protein CMN30_08295 [Sandaracinus sp.]|nr:hypothetical protein [Sandaracinus sp.]|tara:strand:- start:2808 stop:3026 length:219 start_codon:yes stop_codon:yes gene_type:complete
MPVRIDALKLHRVLNYCRNRGDDLEEIAAASEISYGALMDWERGVEGSPTEAEYRRLCHVLGIAEDAVGEIL